MSMLVVPHSMMNMEWWMNVDCSSKPHHRRFEIERWWMVDGGWLTDMDFELSVCTTTLPPLGDLGLAAIILGRRLRRSITVSDGLGAGIG
jgi:hypothetical protein